MLASALTIAAAVFGASPANAVEAPEIPPECGSRASFDSELFKRLPYVQPSAVQLSITEASGHYHLRVQIGSELRELDDVSCTELFRAAVVVAVAMLLHEPKELDAAPKPPRPAPPLHALLTRASPSEPARAWRSARCPTRCSRSSSRAKPTGNT